MRIVHAIARLNVGGAALQVLELAAGQRRLGHDVLVLHGRLADGEDSMAYLAEELGVPTRFVGSLQRELSLRGDWRAVRELRAILRAERPDVLHTHAAKAGATGRIAALLAGAARPRVRVHTFHGHVLRGYFGARRERVFTLVERLLARSSTLVAVSGEVRDDLAALRVAPAERFEVVPYGFTFPAGDASSRAARRAELGLEPGTFVVGYAGRLTPIKRPGDLVAATRALVDEGIDAALVVVGDGPERDEVEELAASLGVAGRCRLLGFRKDVQGWYEAFDVFCLASGNEGTPVAAIEALAAGLPVVATRVGGTPAVVDDGETGFLVEPGDPEALAAQLARLARDRDLAATMGARGAERMRERFATARMVDDVERLYRRLLAA